MGAKACVFTLAVSSSHAREPIFVLFGASAFFRRRLQQLHALIENEGVNHLIHIAVDKGFELIERQTYAVIGDAALGEIICAYFG